MQVILLTFTSQHTPPMVFKSDADLELYASRNSFTIKRVNGKPVMLSQFSSYYNQEMMLAKVSYVELFSAETSNA